MRAAPLLLLLLAPLVQAAAAETSRGAPNVVIILIDDMGFAEASTFGGLAETPHLEKLARSGLRYNNFNTAALCSPTRAALLSGRNHHRVGFGTIADSASVAHAGYNALWPKNVVSVAEVLRRSGYGTAAFGKWHNTPFWEITPAGPFDRWPTGLGFELFYGFLGGHEDQWQPVNLYRNTTAVDARRSAAQGYQLTADVTDEAIEWMRSRQSVAAGKPYFLYFAPGAVHLPHQVPAEWIRRYRGAFDRGWDELRERIFARQKAAGVIPRDARLTPRPDVVPAWSTLSARERELYARQMEVYAAFISYTDHEIGRLLQVIQSVPGAENTLIFYVGGDNGAEAGAGVHGITNGQQEVARQWVKRDELGGPAVSLNGYAAGWAWMGNTPFQWWKSIASHLGSVRNSMVVSWGSVIKDAGAVRGQFTHVTDIAATVLEAAGVSFADVVDGVEQVPLDGKSFAETFTGADARSKHRTQYFEIYGNRAIYQDGWMAAARHSEPWQPARNEGYERDRWELYHLERDFSGAVDLARAHPERLEALVELFHEEAVRNQVYPLMSSATPAARPSVREGRREFIFPVSEERYPWTLVPPLSGKSFRVEAHVERAGADVEGVLVSYNELRGGFVLYVKDGEVIYEGHPVNGAPEIIRCGEDVPSGAVTLGYEYRRDAAASGGEISRDRGVGRISIDGRPCGSGAVSGAVTYRFSSGSLSVGKAVGPQLSRAFSNPFRFTGGLRDVAITLQ